MTAIEPLVVTLFSEGIILVLADARIHVPSHIMVFIAVFIAIKIIVS